MLLLASMRIPYRKPGKFSQIVADPLMTTAKLNELKAELEKLKQYLHPQAAAEVSRLAELGDFSENAEYQLAKGRLRGINSAIFRLGKQIDGAVIINSDRQTDTVKIGCKVTVEYENKQKIFQILGSAETNPSRGIISHNSPIGAALIGHKIGEIIQIKLSDKEVGYKIIGIE